MISIINPNTNHINLSQKDINLNKKMVENKLKLTSDSDLIILSKEKINNTSDDISVNNFSSHLTQHKNSEILTEVWPLPQTLASLKNINTLYFISEQDITSHQKVEVLLTSTGSLHNDLTDAKFIPANKIEQMKIERITQSNNVPNEYTAKITNGKNNIFFFLGQKFGTIISMMFLLFFSVGIVESKNLPPSPKPLDLKQKTYEIYGYNCQNPE